MTFRSGLDGLLEDCESLRSRRYGLLCHQASVTIDWVPAQVALVQRGVKPQLLFGPEHGFFGVEQDMAPAEDQREPWTGIPVVSLYGDRESTLRPRPECFSDLDLLIIDLQDVGARYYTFAATAVLAAEVALSQGCEVWVLDRPNPLGGEKIEGALPKPGYESFVSAFRLPVRHGLTLAEIMALQARRLSWDRAGLRFFEVEGWRRAQGWNELQRPWLAPSPNMPSATTAFFYPGGCLVEGTGLSEGRGTTRPFQLIGAPYVDPVALAKSLEETDLEGVAFLPCYFRPQFQKHSGEVCGGVELLLQDESVLEPFRLGVELLHAVKCLHPEEFAWRAQAYEFVDEIPAIDLLAGGPDLREALGSRSALDDWIARWAEDEKSFQEERAEVLLYD